MSSILTISENEKFHGLDLLQYCGGGAYGDVYYCKDISGRRMAVKIVYKKKLGDDWQRELRGVINYRKITEKAPELLQIFHVEEDEDTFFYTMEAADSTTEDGYFPDTLAGRLKKGPLPEESVYEILSAIFSGIKTIHDAGFAHRDIKPDNILFVGGVPKLGDIGLLSSLTTTATQLAGTMDFLPPELRTEDGTSSSDPLSRKQNDLYAFGKVVYCSITGQSPHDWPALPENLPLTLPLKLFLRLSFSLCDKDPARRLGSISEIRKELDDIKRKLTTGETFCDKLAYQIRRFCINLRSLVIHTGQFLGRHWIVSLIAAACISGGIWYFSPKPPFDITKQKTKLYTNESNGFTMAIPFQWEILSAQTIRKFVEKTKFGEIEKDPLTKKRNAFFRMFVQSGCDYIVCDFDKAFPDNITIQSLPIPSKEFDLPDDELRYRIRKQFEGELGFKTVIYEVKRMTVNGRKCIFIDLSHDPKRIRTNNYLFLLPDRCFSVALTVKSKTFPERKEQFRQILRTMKFTKK